MIMKNYVSDELANKVYHLSKALNSAEKIIKELEIENLTLKDALNNLAPQNKEDYIDSYGVLSEEIYAAKA